jgi:hypothetical protein
MRTDRFPSTLRVLLVVGALLAARNSAADEPVPFEARAGIAVARVAAQSWAPDAVLVWVENDEEMDSTGVSARWGYLYYSPATERARVYSVREGKILLAENLDLKFDAPQLADDWIDSGRALVAAETGAGAEFRNGSQGHLRTMILTRGPMHVTEPDRTTWTVVYAAEHAPSLFVVIDAQSGKVLRTWRG